MRALFLHAHPAWGGEARVFASVAGALAERGHESWFAAPAGSEAAMQAAQRGLTVIALPQRRSARRDARHVRHVLPRDFVDVVFVHTDAEHLAAAFATRGAKRGAVVRRIAAGGEVTQTWRRRRAERLVPTRYLYTSESPPSAHLVASGTPTPMRAELGVDVPESSNGAGGPNATVLVCMATRESLRRATNVLRAVALLVQRHRNLTLRVIGSVAQDEDLKILATALGLGRRVEWLGHPLDLAAALRGAAAGWVIADGDEAGLGALELMAHGVVVLAERTSIASRYVSNGIHGVLMTQLDPALMAAEAAVLLADAERRTAMGQAGRLRVEREFSLREMLAGFEQAAHSSRERQGRRG
ncbi:MAG: glycosyltransferase family 4 protein [Gemmatimonadaceae bacterium]